MRVVIDTRWIGATPSGVGVYALELARRLPVLAPDLEFVLLFDQAEARARVLDELGPSRVPNLEAAILPAAVFSLASQVLLPGWLSAQHSRLFHSPNYMIPYRAFRPGGGAGSAGRCVTTIHDVIPLLLPDHAPRARKSRLMPLFRWCLRESARRSAAVLTVSETSRRDLIAALRLDAAVAGRVQAIHNGVDPSLAPADSTRRRAAQAARTILYVGRLDPYKQVVSLVRAFGMVRRRCACPLHLVIVGPEDVRYPEARQMTEALGLKESVTFLGFLRADELRATYQEATMLVNPSRYEGFGLQLVEAMRCGVPVVCTDGGAQPEVVGDAARVVPAGDTHALAEAMVELLTDETQRQTLIARGLQRAGSFDWDRTAAATLAVYRRLLQPDGEAVR